MHSENSNIILKGIVGAGTNVLAVITSTQEQFEFWFRISSLSLGMCVGALTIVSLCRNLRRK